MYRQSLPPRDRAATISLVLLIHAGLGLALLNASGRLAPAEQQPDLQLFDVTDPPPPPPIVEEIPEPEKARPKKEEGAASAKNIESKATPVAAPKPRIALPVPPPMPVTETPNSGRDPTQGASDVVGPGTGAGGSGTGTGSGGSGSGTGGGGSGGSGVKLVRYFTNREYPREIQRSWPRGGAIFARVRVEADGRVSRCDVQRSFGNSAADQWTCALILQQRATFQPARDGNGRPIAAWYGYVQRDLGRFDR